MRTESSKRLVIDACVLSNAGELRETSSASVGTCRELLQAVLAIRHTMVMTPELSAEWHRHPTKFARKWMKSMCAHKQWCWVAPAADVPLRAALTRAAVGDKQLDAMLKDAHLLEAAAATDKTIVSLERESKKLYDCAAGRYGPLRAIAWVNPDAYGPARLRGWLEAGAPAEQEMMIGYAEKPAGKE
jgi:hypothetical protein